MKRFLVIEDVPAGIETGRKAEMRVIVINATHAPEELLKKGADIVFDQLTNLKIDEILDEYRLVIQVK